MKQKGETLYQANDFAELTGVTVRALHHYDELGLLKPRRSESGYRLYGEQEFARLQQIVTLKFIGLSLKEIKALLGRKKFDLESTLLIQREVIQSKRRQLDLVAKAIERADQALKSEGKPNWNLFRKIVEEIEMETQTEWMKQYYTQEQLDELSKRWRPEMQEQVTKDWNSLFQDAESLANEDPASSKAQALAERWEKQIAAFTGGNPEIADSLKKLYQDKKNWPETAKKQWGPSLSKTAEEFINQAREIWMKKKC
jgi:DNA-binding transcriptional MerR regulator